MEIAKRGLFLITLLGILFLPLVAFAQLIPYLGRGPVVGFLQIINGIITAAWIIFTVIVIICFVLAGVQFLTAQGNPQKLTQARAAFFWGVAGVVVGILAYTIITVVGSIF